MRLNIKDNSTPRLEEYKQMVAGVNLAVTTMLARESAMLSNNIKGGLIDQRPGGQPITPISKATIILRGIRKKNKGQGGTKALIDSGSMVNAVTSRKKSKYHYTAGVHRNARGKGGKKLANIAAIHEYGTRVYTITVTEKMRRFSFVLMRFGLLHAPWRVGKKLKKRIEARPWLNPTTERWEKNADERFTNGLAAILGIPM